MLSRCRASPSLTDRRSAQEYERRARELDDSLVVGKPEAPLFLVVRKQPVWSVQAWSERVFFLSFVVITQIVQKVKYFLGTYS